MSDANNSSRVGEPLLEFRSRSALEPLFNGLVKSTRVMEIVHERWRFLMRLPDEKLQSLELTPEQSANLESDLSILVTIKEATPFHFNQQLPPLDTLQSDKERYEALILYLSDVSVAVGILMQVYLDNGYAGPDNRSSLQLIGSIFSHLWRIISSPFR